MTEQSKFVLVLDKSATPVNRRPILKGEYKLAGAEASRDLALWGGVSEKTGKLYARGKATPQGIADALRATGTAADVQAPPNVDLKVGEAVLFENAKATAENKQPKFFGYAREADRYVRLSGWTDKNPSVITGNAEPYRPSQNDAAPEGDAPKVGG